MQRQRRKEMGKTIAASPEIVSRTMSPAGLRHRRKGLLFGESYQCLSPRSTYQIPESIPSLSLSRQGTL